MTSFWLEFEQGGQTQQVSFDKETVTLGRDGSSDFVLDHPTVSRQHALIVSQGGQFQLVVLSRGGLTAVNGQRVQDSEVELYDGVSITLGKYTVRFRSRQAAPRPATQGPPTPGGAVGGGELSSPQSGGIGGGQGKGNGGFSSPPGQAPAGGSSPGRTGLGSSSTFQGPQGLSGEDEIAGQPPGGAPPAMPPQEEAEQVDDGGPGIKSWDEIAASSEDGDSSKEEEADDGRRALQQIREQSGDDESNPVLIVGALVAAVGFLGFAVFSGGGDDEARQQAQRVPIAEQEPVELTVDCYEPASCQREAERHYDRGMDLIEQRAVETGNLFEGYHRLLQAQKALEEAGVEEIPEDEMPDWHEMHDMAREELDRRFREFRMRYHQADQRDRYREMASVLDEIQENFPERTARENQWAREHERSMQAEGIYPRR